MAMMRYGGTPRAMLSLCTSFVALADDDLFMKAT